MAVNCEDCKHFDATDDTCHRRAPIVLLDPTAGPVTWWPDVKPMDWCSEGVKA